MMPGKMVLSGSMDEIMERIYTSKQIIISVQDQMEKALVFLKESPMVRTISICEKDIMVGFTGDERRESELLKQMIEAGIPVRGLCGSRAAWSPSSCRSQIIIRKRWCCL